MTNLPIEIQGDRTLNEKINLRGNREQHHSNSFIWGCPKKQRRGVWISNKHITKNTRQTYIFIPPYAD